MEEKNTLVVKEKKKEISIKIMGKMEKFFIKNLFFRPFWIV